jgi:Kelch motif
MNHSRLWIVVALFLFVSGVSAEAQTEIAILYSDTINGQPVDLGEALSVSYLVDGIDYTDVSATTPTLVALQDYAVVLVHLADAPADRAALGNVLAAYADLPGTGVILDAGAFTSGLSATGGLDAKKPLPDGDAVGVPAGLGTPADHPILQGITVLAETDYTDSPLGSGATSLGTFDDGVSLLGAIKSNIVALNFQSANGGLGGQEDHLHVNALHFLLGVLDPWITRQPLPASRYSGALVSDGRYHYYFGGFDDADQPTATLLRYDPVADIWTTLTAGAIGTARHAGAYFDGKLYFFGGFDTDVISGTWIYDIAGNSWSTGLSAPTPVADHGAALLDGYIYLIGGFDGADNTKLLQRYDPVGNTWLAMTASTIKHARAAVGVLKRQIYVACGTDELDVPTNVCEVYDPVGNAWSNEDCADAHFTFDDAGGMAWNGRLFTVGGSEWPAAAMIYDPNRDAWYRWNTYLNEPTVANRVTAFGSSLYTAGGVPDGTAHEATGVCEYDGELACGDEISGDTSAASDYYDGYSCDVDRGENGGDVRFLLTVAQDAFVTATLTVSTEDLDVALLGECDPSTCLSLDPESTTAFVAAGNAVVAVDGPGGLAGPFTLQIECCTGCYIDGACYANGELDPGNTCGACDVGQSRTGWSLLGDGASCDDDLFCNGEDTCLAGSCTEHTGDPCDVGQQCNEVGDQCLDPGDDDDDDDDNDDDDTTPADDDDDDDAMPGDDDDDDTNADDDDDATPGDDDDDDDDSGGGCGC